jgi:hypothetical protein
VAKVNVIENRTEVTQGYPMLIVETDEGQLRIGIEQKLAGRGLIFCGAHMEEVLPPIKLAADPANGQGKLTLRGFTRDAEIVRLYEAFIADDGADNG